MHTLNAVDVRVHAQCSGCTRSMQWMFTLNAVDVHAQCSGCTRLMQWMYTPKAVDVHA